MKALNLLILLSGLALTGVGAASGPDADTVKLISDLGLKESERPVSEQAYWQKPERIVVLLDERRKQTRPDAINWLKAVAGDADRP